MAEIKIIKYSDNFKTQHDPAADSLKMSSFLTANYELTDALLGLLVNGEDGSSAHHHDGRYYRENEHINVSTGAEDAAKPVLTDAAGKLSNTFIDVAALNAMMDHGTMAGLEDDDHVMYIRTNGLRAFTADQSMGGFKLTNLAAPTDANDAARKSYVDSVAAGLRPKGNVAAATTGDITLSGLQTIDGYAVQDGDRILVKDQTDQTQNGIYVAATGAWERSIDQDNSPLAEVVNGILVPRVLNGTANVNKGFFISSVGTGEDGMHVIGTDPVIFDIFTSPTQLTEGDGVSINANVVSVALKELGGLKIDNGEIMVEPADFAGQGLRDDGSDKMALDFSTAYNDLKAVSAADLSSTLAGKGASIIGVQDSNNYFAGTNQEAVNNELYLLAVAGGGVEYTAGTGGVSKGQLVYLSVNDTVVPYSDITQARNVVGMALSSAAQGEAVKVARLDKPVTGILTAATAGEEMYWTGSGFSASAPTASGSHVWMVGIAKNATDLSLEINHLYTVA